MQLAEPEIGFCIRVTSSRLLDAMKILGMEDALAYFQKCGVGSSNMDMNKYCLSEVIDGLYVFRHAPEAGKQKETER
jgi:hypothetical protein